MSVRHNISSVGGKKAWQMVRPALLRNNAVFVTGLGLCSALAVTTRVSYALAMSAGVMFVALISSLCVSLTRKLIPSRIRLPYYTLIIATLVICFDRYLKAFFPLISDSMGPYVGLIITNCIIMGRAEAFASKNKPFASVIDAFGYASGYAVALICMATIRELLGFGAILGYPLMWHGWKNWVIMTMSPGAFIVCAVCVWIANSILKYTDTKYNSEQP